VTSGHSVQPGTPPRAKGQNATSAQREPSQSVRQRTGEVCHVWNGLHAAWHLALCRALMKPWFVLSFALALVALTGCKGSCRNLAERLCNCQATTAAQQACLQNVANEDGRIGPTSQDNDLCQQMLVTCDCHTVNTPEGKVLCGLARPADGSFTTPVQDPVE
jgi:hypothetical protein